MTTYRLVRLLTSSAFAIAILATVACTPELEPTATGFLSPISPTTFSSPPSSLEVPTPKPGKGGVLGRLSLANFPFPLRDAELYLGDISSSGNDTFSTYFFDRAANPKAQWVSTETGDFAFENVDPGEYVLIIWWDIDGWAPVYRSGTSQDIQVEVVAGQVTQLGLIESDQ